ncbi:MAG: glycosyltransferase family 9 protein [Thermogemmatispora sp.]|uniref:glycosyltransferase family 9 protein n=1 Tax=Thermogemmatispora sp. TaxID=1968838 RepID=UPI00262421F5|nr:glycosyltransferase family 9 protein [Thermogemmatispora sp.]MBX5456746.1 glycosyltransferase family 9 protein [Thermogemmatispora sp.]
MRGRLRKEWLRRMLLLLIYLLGLPGSWLAQRRARHPLSSARAPRLLLLRPDHLGDLVLTTPALTALKEHCPTAQITLFVGPWSQAIVMGHPAAERVLTCAFPGFRRAAQGALSPYWLLLRLAWQLRRERYDLAINLRPDFWWGAALLYLAGIPHRVGYALAPGRRFLTHALPFPEGEHSTCSSLRLVSVALQLLGQAPLAEPFTPERYPLLFGPTAQEEERATALLAKAGLTGETPFAVIHPGSGAAVKLWRPEGWATCAVTLLRRYGLRLVLTGTPQEQALLEEIATLVHQQLRADEAPPVSLSTLSIGELAAVLRRAQLALGVDSGPLHVAVSQGTPTVALYGPADPRIFGPWGDPRRHVVILASERCPACPKLPCGRLDIPPQALPSHPCVRLIPEERVLAAVEQLLPARML